MFYQPDRKMTIAILTNYGGAKLYAVAKALFESIPVFTCGNKNKKEDKIIVCFNGNDLCVDRTAAAGFISRGAYLGSCQSSPATKQSSQLNSIDITDKTVNHLQVYPNPSAGNMTFSFTPQERGNYDLSLYDITGRLIATLYNKISDKGVPQRIQWNGEKIAMGTYILCLQTPTGIERQKIVVGK
jgi:hypothetical protein